MIDVEVEDPAWTSALPNAEALTLGAADAAMLSEGAIGEGVTVLLTDDAKVQPLPRNTDRALPTVWS